MTLSTDLGHRYSCPYPVFTGKLAIHVSRGSSLRGVSGKLGGFMTGCFIPYRTRARAFGVGLKLMFVFKRKEF